MKITRIETICVAIPFHYANSLPPVNLETLLVRVDTDEGITGWGEAFGYKAIPATRAAVDHMIAPLALGRDATAIEEISTDIQKALHNFGRFGQTMFALSGLDIALWDIAGKAAGLPLHRLLGNGETRPLRAYASLLPYPSPESVAEHVAAASGEGYVHIKLHERTVSSVHAAREAAPDAALMVDVNCPWNPAEAAAMAAAFRPFDLHWLEEPVWPPEDYRGLAEVSKRSPMPIAAGENAVTLSEFETLIAARAVAVVQPSVTKVGGITPFRKIAALCSRENARLAPHSPYFGPGFLATLHLSAGTGQPVERYYGRLKTSLFGDRVDASDGMLRVPEQPGLGCDPDPEVVRRFRIDC